MINLKNRTVVLEISQGFFEDEGENLKNRTLVRLYENYR